MEQKLKEESQNRSKAQDDDWKFECLKAQRKLADLKEDMKGYGGRDAPDADRAYPSLACA